MYLKTHALAAAIGTLLCATAIHTANAQDAQPPNPAARTLVQVKVDDLADADDIFTKLMGDVVEPRREFIQQNALNVENLDV